MATQLKPPVKCRARTAGFLMAGLLLAGCMQTGETPQFDTESPAAQSSSQAVNASSKHLQPAGQEFNGAAAASYVDTLVQGIAAKLAGPEMSEYDKAKAAFDYMIEHTVLDEPIGLEIWRIHGGGEVPIPYLEQRAISPLQYGAGMCEDYAAALTLLLQGMGLEARYVPGLTYSAEGNLVDHAWTAVRIDGVWYHLDSQLEDNISRRKTIRHRYFLKSDATMAASHRWGERLIASGLLTEAQNAEIAESWLIPTCPADYPPPERRVLSDAPPPDTDALRREAAAEIAAYEAENGPLTRMELNTAPPVFGLDGFGPPNEG